LEEYLVRRLNMNEAEAREKLRKVIEDLGVPSI